MLVVGYNEAQSEYGIGYVLYVWIARKCGVKYLFKNLLTMSNNGS